jgi:hypothetical protein
MSQLRIYDILFGGFDGGESRICIFGAEKYKLVARTFVRSQELIYRRISNLNPRPRG